MDSEGGGVPLARQSRRDPEVSEPDVAGRSVDQDVGRLDVLVDQARCVNMADSLGERDRQTEEHPALQRRAEQPIEQLAAGVVQHQGHALPVAHERDQPCGPPRIEIHPQSVLMLEPLHGGGRGVVATDRGHQQSARKAVRGGRVPAAVQ
jgi:hypothetical protein